MTDQDNDKPQPPQPLKTVRDRLLEELRTNPHWKEAPKTGQGFVIGGPEEHMTEQDQPTEPQDAPAPKPTAREIYTKLAATNPQFKLAKNTGQGFVIVGAMKP
jgi:hypothetical protein